ncbi:hypothetical protein F4823DRAFT_32342 [Ustulina deusta]|nr:hypothetical protein F4823DRAFT_32342 [Ustulina deusta]
MDPIAHIWLARLKDGHSIVEAAFSSARSESQRSAALHATARGEHHALFQCNDQPDLLAVMGYYSDDNDPGGNKTREKRASLFLQFVTHQELFLFNVDVTQIALDSDNIAVLFSESQPSGSKPLPGRGDWAVPVPPPPVEHQSERASEPPKKTWVQVVASEDADRLSQAGAIKRFNKFMESRIVLQSEE